MRNLAFLLFCSLFLANLSIAQTPNQVLLKSYNKFAQVSNFSGKVDIDFDLPSINIEKMNGKVYYKAPKKFRVKLSGIAFLPKQDPFYVIRLLKDSTSYVSVFSGNETIRQTACKIVTVIPNNDPELVMAKLWIDSGNQNVMRSQITTKSNGTGSADYTYRNYAKYALPDDILFTVDMATFKMPKMVAVDLNSKKKAAGVSDKKGAGTILFKFTEYVINKGVDDKVFSEE